MQPPRIDAPSRIAPTTGPPTGSAFPSMLRPLVRTVVEIEQGICLGAGHQNHVATRRTIAATRTAARHVLFPTKRGHPIPAVSGTGVEFDLIFEYRLFHKKRAGIE